ncbi:hypothetical protein HDV02_004560, partial [Globomyces sp. JEL0801]
VSRSLEKQTRSYSCVCKQSSNTRIDVRFLSTRGLQNKNAFDKRNAAIDEEKEKPMDPTESLGLLGSKEGVLLVAVASPTSSATPRENSTLKLK